MKIDKTTESLKIVLDSKMFVMFVTPDVDCTARNISERHKIKYKRRLEKEIEEKNTTRIL
jgi:hypothetical protein